MQGKDRKVCIATELAPRGRRDLSKMKYSGKKNDKRGNWPQLSTSTDLLWHYTTPEGLTGIIESNSLWATNIFYLNDSAEFMHGIDTARRIIKQKISSLREGERKRLDSFDTHLSFVGPDHNRAIYVCSLSKTEDELSQWRAYCRGGGFSIGFPRQGLVNAIHGQHFELKECVYGAKEQEEIIRHLIDSHVIPYIEKPEQFSKIPCTPDMVSAIVSGGIGEFLWELYSTCSSLKHPSFEREKEWRLVFDHKRPFNEVKPEFRTKNGLIIPYICIKLPQNEDFWKQIRIIIGPTKYEKELEGSVRALFRKYYEYSLRITPSEIPFREL